MEQSCLGQKGHPSIQVTLADLTFYTFFLELDANYLHEKYKLESAILKVSHVNGSRRVTKKCKEG